MVRWPRENLVELIAWLDFSLSHEGINFSDTIADHLKASCDKEYTFEQVERKLRSVWSSHGPKTDSQYTWLDVYNHGSQILSRLTDEQLDAIARAHARLEDGATAKLLAVRERPRTRSASKSGNFRFSPHISLENFQTKQSPQYYKRQHTGSVTPCPAKRESEPVDLGTYEGLTPPKRAKKSSPLKPKTPPNGNRFTRLQRSISKASATNIQIEIDDSDIECHIEDENKDEPKQNEDQEEIIEKDCTQGARETSSSDANSGPDDSAVDDSLDEESHNLMTKVRLRTANERLLKGRLDTAISQMKAFRRELRHKQSELQQEEDRTKKLQIQKGLLQSAQRERDLRSGEPFEELIRLKDQYIDKLKGRLEDREKLGFFTKSFQISQIKRSSMPLDEGFKDIYSACQHIPCQYDRDRPLFVPALDMHDDLRILVCKGLGIEPHENAWAKKVNVDFSKLTPQAIVRAVTTSALREWVFEDDFPRLHSESELLAKYRESVANLDGVLALRNLDLAAHSSIIKSDLFQNRRIPRKARKLARRLSRTLAPFFVKDSNHPKESDLYGFNKWGQEKEEYEERQAIFENICTCALKTKANSILNLEDYQMVIYTPGTEYDKSTMEVENIGGIPQRNGNFDGRVIWLCVQAAVFSYPKRELGEDVTKFMAEALVQSRNFSHTGNVQREGGKLLVPARVILRDDQPAVRSSVSDTMSDDDTSGLSDISTPTDY